MSKLRLNKKLIKGILAEVKKREKLEVSASSYSEKLTSLCFPKQLEIIQDRSRRQVYFCTRRAAKSTTLGIKLFMKAFEYPNSSVVYLQKTRRAAKDKFFIPILKDINRRLSLNAQFNDTDLTVYLPQTNSYIYCYGADSSPDDIEKLLGGKHPLVVIDECQSWRQDLKDFVEAKLIPTTTDYLGEIILAGTPGNLIRTYFHKLTTREDKDMTFKIHEWTVFDNPFMREQIEIELNEMKANNPLIVETPAYRQMWLKEWVVDDSLTIYKFNSDRNLTSKAPLLTHYVLGVDLGWEDKTAFTLIGWTEKDPNLYIVRSHGASHMDFDQVAATVQEYADDYDLDNIIIDGANKQGIETMRNRTSLPFEAANKLGKFEHIQLMNNDFIAGKIKLLPDTKALQDEYLTLVRDENSVKWKEDPGCENHMADSALYAYTQAYHYFHRPEAPKKSLEQIEEEQEDEYYEQRQNQPWWD